jgi:uncharacterized repeat protein (TIGR02543 family)
MIDENYPGSLLSAPIIGDGSLVLKVYYLINAHDVIYEVSPPVPADAPGVPATQKEIYNKTVAVKDALSHPGYTFSGWTTTTPGVVLSSSNSFPMPDHDVTFAGTWTSASPGDIDDDGIPNGQDPDVDGDGIPNGQDNDIDGDGIPNGQDFDDIDADGIPNAQDPDIDADGIPKEALIKS